MKAFAQRILTSPRYSKALEWGKLITFTGGAQVVVQLSGLLCGILIIRLLPTQEYALYTLANTMLATMVILADSGVTLGVMAEGSKVWQEPPALGVVLATGFDLRKKFAVGSLAVAVPLLAYLLLHQGASALTAGAIIAALIPAFLAALSDSIYEVVPKLHQDIRALQKNQISVSIARTVLSAALLAVSPLTSLALLANLIPRIYGNLQLKKLAARRAVMPARVDPEVKSRILRTVQRSLPGLLYYCVSGQLTIWLISFFGQARSVATLGALNRLTMGIGLLSSVFTVLVVPRFARLPNHKPKVRTVFVQTQFLLLLISVLVLLVVWVAGAQILWVIGDKYRGMEPELFLLMLSSCMVLMVGGTYSLYSTKGWIMHPAQSISVSVVSSVVGIWLFSASTLKGVIYINIFVAFIEYLNHLVYSILKINKMDSGAAEPHSLNYANV